MAYLYSRDQVVLVAIGVDSSQHIMSYLISRDHVVLVSIGVDSYLTLVQIEDNIWYLMIPFSLKILFLRRVAQASMLFIKSHHMFDIISFIKFDKRHKIKNNSLKGLATFLPCHHKQALVVNTTC